MSNQDDGAAQGASWTRSGSMRTRFSQRTASSKRLYSARPFSAKGRSPLDRRDSASEGGSALPARLPGDARGSISSISEEFELDDVVPVASDKPTSSVSGPGAKYVRRDYAEHGRRLTHQDSSASLRSAKFRGLRKKNLVGQRSIETIQSSDIDFPTEHAPDADAQVQIVEERMPSAGEGELTATPDVVPKPTDSVGVDERSTTN